MSARDSIGRPDGGTKPRGCCPVCAKGVRLRKDGRIGGHGYVADFETVGEFIVYCSGVGMLPRNGEADA